MSVPLTVGALLALACLAYVLYPLMRAGKPAASRGARPVTDEEIEAAVHAYRVAHASGAICAVCGARPESDALFCSSCGRRLNDRASSS
jgi:hypothetical protein